MRYDAQLKTDITAELKRLPLQMVEFWVKIENRHSHSQ